MLRNFVYWVENIMVYYWAETLSTVKETVAVCYWVGTLAARSVIITTNHKDG